MADIVLPATMFLEHDDLYQGGGHQYIMFGPKAIEPPDGCRSNHDLVCALAGRLGAEHRGFAMTPARNHRLDAGGLGLGLAGGARGQEMARRAAALRGGAFPQGLRLQGRPLSLQGGLGDDAVLQQRPDGPLARNARPARPLGGHRRCRRGASVPARHLALAQLPQFDLQRNADFARAASSARP